MTKVTQIAGGILIALGLGAMLLFQTPTALIPAYFGLPLWLCGWLAGWQSLRKHAMHAAAAIALLGTLLPGIMVAGALVRLAESGSIARPVALTVQAAMALVCGVFLGLCVRSFVAARRNRAAESA